MRLAGEIHLSSMIAPKPLPEFETLKKKAIKASEDAGDAYIRHWTRYVIGFEEFCRGRVNDARDTARELMEVGRQSNDPRCTGMGLAGLTMLAMLSGSPTVALDYSEQALAVAVTPHDRMTAILSKGTALVLLGRTEEGAKLLDDYRRLCTVCGALYGAGFTDGTIGVVEILRGNIRQGIDRFEGAILRQHKDENWTVSDWERQNLAEVYLQIITAKEKPPFWVLLRNLPILLKVVVIAPTRIRALATRILENPRYDPAGIHVGRAKMILGLLYKVKKKRALAIQYLAEAQRIISQFGASPILTKIETALAELA
jgi:hypothetical protein